MPKTISKLLLIKHLLLLRVLLTEHRLLLLELLKLWILLLSLELLLLLIWHVWHHTRCVISPHLAHSLLLVHLLLLHRITHKLLLLVVLEHSWYIWLETGWILSYPCVLSWLLSLRSHCRTPYIISICSIRNIYSLFLWRLLILGLNFGLPSS